VNFIDGGRTENWGGPKRVSSLSSQVAESAWKTIIAALILCLAALSNSAQQNGDLPKDGNGLLTACNAVIQTVDSPTTINGAKGDEFALITERVGWCVGYLQAVIDAGFRKETEFAIFSPLGVTLSGPEKERQAAAKFLRGFYCVPTNVTVLQVSRVVVKYLRDHPERLHETPGILVHAAMHDAFPVPETTVGLTSEQDKTNLQPCPTNDPLGLMAKEKCAPLPPKK
jgi:hypothetical protein